MTFSSPWYLLLFLLLPLVMWLGWPRRGPARQRQTLSLTLRIMIFAALVFSLSGFSSVRATRNIAVVFLVDVSDSMPPEFRGLAVQWVRDSLAEMQPDDQAAVILFGGDALVEQPMQHSALLESFASVPTTIETDMEEAIRLALALFPGGYGKRIVILSDGAETTGDADQAAQLAAASGVQIMVVPYSFQRDTEMLLTDVRAPSVLRQGEEFDLSVTIEATRPMETEIRVFSGESLVFTDTLEVNSGANSFLIPLVAGEPGFTTFNVQLVPPEDSFYQNNEMAAFSDVQGPPRVLVVASPTNTIANPAQNLVQVLELAGIDYDLTGPTGLPSELQLLAEYASVVLVDVPARQLTQRQQLTLEQYVRDLGGGMVAVGGEQSYGVGGWYNTALERMLPVDMQLRDQERRPQLAIVFIIDKSGSMTDTSSGLTKLDLAKEAAIRSIELLSPMDAVGVIAFDDSASWVVPITPLEEAGDVVARVGTIRPGGGTDILAGVQAMARELPDYDSKIKHVILLTDGGASEFGIAELVERLYEEDGITFSAVGVGQGAAPFLPDLAQAGGGRYHYTDDAASIPEIFTEETVLATRAYIIEEEFFPIQTASSPILNGITSVPSLVGYIGTSPKDAAQTILVSNLADGNQDPILASWQYGLGRTVAWTSDATGRWATNWVNWEGFPRLWAQIIRYTIGSSIDADLTADVRRVGEAAVLNVDALDRSGDYLNGLPLQASIVMPDGTSLLIDMTQTAPGRYQAEFIPSEEGAYLIRVAGGEETNGTLGQTTGWVLSYSPEYKVLQADSRSLLQAAAITGGDTIFEPAEAFDLRLTAQRDVRPLWPWLLLLAVLLLPVDIAVRRLAISRYDVQRAWHWVSTRVLGLRRTKPGKVHSEATSRLMQAKRRASVSATSAASTRTAPEVAPPSEQPTASPPPLDAGKPSTPTPRPKPTPKPAAPDTSPEKPASQPSGSTASALLSKKRRRTGQDE